MSRNDKDSLKRQEQEKLQTILSEILKEEDNKYCADCEAKGPRWASWNLGVFLCIRCAGIHRNLGVHISRVKSVNLDTWTVEQVQSVRVLGNSLAKALYEANLPSGFRRPQTDSSLEAFIRAKYEHKRYVDKDLCAPKVDPRDLMIELENLTNRRKLLTADAANATTTNASSGNIQMPPKTSPGAKRKEKKDPSGRKPSGGGQKSVSSTNCSDTSNLNDLVDLTLDLGGDLTALSSPAPKGTVDDLLGLADLHPSHIQQPIRNHSSPFLPSFINTDAVAVDNSLAQKPPPNLSPLAAAAAVVADGSSAGDFANFTAAASSPQQQQTPSGAVDGQPSATDGNLFSLAGAGTASDKKSKNDILALYSSGGGANVATTPTIPNVPFMPTGAVTSGYYAPYPNVPTPMNYAYPTTANPVPPIVYGGVPSPMPAMFGGVPQQPTQPIAPGFGYSNVVIPPHQHQQQQMAATPFVQQQQQPSFAVGGMPPQQMVFGNHGNPGQQQASQLQHVRDQLAALQIQRAQQPQQSNVVAANTLATNLWQ